MAIFDNFPWTNVHELNLDWIVKKIKELYQDTQNLETALNQIKENLSDDVKAQLEAWLEDGTLQELVDETLYKEISTKVNNLSVSSPATAFVDDAICFPLWVNKYYTNGTSGTIYAPQGMTATYENGQPKNIYSFNEYGTERHLLNMSCGNRSTGTGWTYSEITNMPITHGSCLSIKDNIIYIANENGYGTVYTYDLIAGTYDLLDLTHLTNTAILGCVYDSDTDTYLINCNSNNTMIITDSQFNELRRYTHNIIYDTNNLTYQGYDYKNGLEYRTMSYQNTNCLLVYNTYTGDLVKTINLVGFNGEIEDVSIYNGTALISIVNYNIDYVNIQMNAILECYIGGITDNNMLIQLQQRATLGNNFFNLLLNKRSMRTITAYYQNNNDNGSICRYAGCGTQANPIKSGAVLSSLAVITQYAVQNALLNFNILTSTNTDDNALHIEWGPTLSIYVNGNNNTISRAFIRNLHLVQFDNLNIDATNSISRLTNRDMTLAFINEIQLRSAMTVRNLEIVDTTLLVVYGTVTTTGTGSVSRCCLSTTGSSRLPGVTISDVIQ